MGHDAFAAALELAATHRHAAAREKLKAILASEPGNVEALILLGKVEYYLRHDASSRACFQTALIYDPRNIAAYFALEFFKRRRSTILLIVCAFAVWLTLIAAGALAYGRARADLGGAQDAVMGELSDLRATIRGLQDDTRALESSATAQSGRFAEQQTALIGLERALRGISRSLAAIDGKLDGLAARVKNASPARP